MYSLDSSRICSYSISHDIYQSLWNVKKNNINSGAMLCSLRCSTRRLLVPNAVEIKSGLSRNSLRRYHFQSQINSNSDKIIPSIIALNGIVFAGWYLSFRDIKLQIWMRKHFSLTQLGIFREGNLHTLVTSFFSHYDPIHLLSNMIVLYSFGQNAINILGGYRFLALYFGGGLVSSVCHLLWPYVVPRHWPARYSQNRFAGGLGASGAVNSIVMFHILTYPRHMLYLFGVVPVPAALAGAAFVGMDLFGLYTGSSSYGNAAHLGGAALGAGVAMYLRRRRFR